MNTEIKKRSLTSEPEYGRIMPQARDLEEAVIGAVLLEKTAFETANDILSPEMFYDKANGLIFAACICLDAERKPVDLLTVVEQLRKSGTLESVGGRAYIAKLSQKVVSSFHLEYHCYVVKDKYLHRRLIEICSSGTDLGFDDTEDIDETVARLNADIERLQEEIVGKKDTRHISEAAKASIEQMHDRIADRMNGITPGIPTGFADLDKLTNGWRPEKFVVIASRPGVGKTSIAVKFARQAARHGTPVVFFSLEMGETELTDRMITAEAGINADDYNSGEIQPPEWSRAETAMENISRLPVYIEDNPKVTVGNIANKARLLKKQGKCGMVIIDYMQLITPSVKLKVREQEVGEISRLLKIYAKELKVPFIVLCQMNRDIEAEKREPRLSDLRESGAIEQDADTVIFINRPGMYVEELRDKKTGELLVNYMELLVKKHRGGKLGKIKLKHNDSMTDFFDYDTRKYSEINPERNYKNYYEKDNEPF